MHIRGPIEPMLAKAIDRLPPPNRSGYRYEMKWDGYRAVARVEDNSAVHIHSRRGTLLDEAFPELIGAIYAAFPAGTVVDGEVVRWNRNRLDFEALQRRYAQRRRAAALAVSEPAHLVLWDVLETARDGDLRRRPLKERRKVLERLFRRVPKGSPLTLAAQTGDEDVALTWYEDMVIVGVEGIVIKPAQGLYVPGARGWFKYKARQTTDAVIGGVTGSLRRPAALLLGRYSSTSGVLHYAGRTTQLSDAQAKVVGPLLTRAAAANHPWPNELVTNWKTKPTRYVRVEPLIVVEISADVATDHGRRWRHAVRYRRLRDIAPDEVPRDLDIEA